MAVEMKVQTMFLLFYCLTPRSIVQEMKKTNVNVGQAELNLHTNHLGPLITSKFRSFNGKNPILHQKPCFTSQV